MPGAAAAAVAATAAAACTASATAAPASTPAADQQPSRCHRCSHFRLLPERPEKPRKSLSATERAALAAAEGGSTPKRGVFGCFGRKPTVAAEATNGLTAVPSGKPSTYDGDVSVTAVRVADVELSQQELQPAAP